MWIYSPSLVCQANTLTITLLAGKELRQKYLKRENAQRKREGKGDDREQETEVSREEENWKIVEGVQEKNENKTFGGFSTPTITERERGSERGDQKREGRKSIKVGIRVVGGASDTEKTGEKAKMK